MSKVGGIILGLIGGLISIFLGVTLKLLFPEFEILGDVFISVFRTIMIIGGIITLIGVFISLFTKKPDSIRIAWIIILIGGLLGGGNVISIIGAMQFKWYIKDIQ